MSSDDADSPTRVSWSQDDYLKLQFGTADEHRSSADFANLPSSQVLARLAHVLLVGAGGLRAPAGAGAGAGTGAVMLQSPSAMFFSPFPKYRPEEAYRLFVERGYRPEDARLLSTPFQEESVFMHHPAEATLTMTGKSGGAGMYGLWEQNLEQMKAVYVFYAQGGGGSKRRESMTGNSIKTAVSSMNKSLSSIEAVAVSTAKQKDSSMLDFEKCKSILQNFQIYPKHVDLKTVQALFRYTKQWEWTWAEDKLSTQTRTASSIASKQGGAGDKSQSPMKQSRRHVRSSISFLALERENSRELGTVDGVVEPKLGSESGNTAIAVTARDVRKCESSTLLTFRGFIELLTRLALYIHVHNLDHNSQVYCVST